MYRTPSKNLANVFESLDKIFLDKGQLMILLPLISAAKLKGLMNY